MHTRRIAGLLMIITLFVSLAIVSCQRMDAIRTATEEEPICGTASAGDSATQAPSGATEGGSIYVSTSGKDESGDGSITNPYRTIECALTVAQPGDEIVLRGAPALDENRYREDVRIQQPNITIRSETGEWAIIECPINDEDVHACVRFDVDSSGGKLQRVEVIGTLLWHQV